MLAIIYGRGSFAIHFGDHLRYCTVLLINNDYLSFSYRAAKYFDFGTKTHLHISSRSDNLVKYSSGIHGLKKMSAAEGTLLDLHIV